ncbi:MAG TPA: D-aminoacyl-tRNA deacylase [Dehalococcoidia bacterium]|nr:D-aminoacyl-tRNA deacylase [Dehalococcoidia bacterium]
MRAVLQRVERAWVAIEGERIAEIGPGLLILLGVAQGDQREDAAWLARKTAELRIFSDEEGRFNRSLLDCAGAALVVSQFTLLADTRRGRRPSFVIAARPEEAEPLVQQYAETLRAQGVAVQSGRFGAHMLVGLENDGPVTIILESERKP